MSYTFNKIHYYISLYILFCNECHQKRLWHIRKYDQAAVAKSCEEKEIERQELVGFKRKEDYRRISHQNFERGSSQTS